MKTGPASASPCAGSSRTRRAGSACGLGRGDRAGGGSSTGSTPAQGARREQDHGQIVRAGLEPAEVGMDGDEIRPDDRRHERREVLAEDERRVDRRPRRPCRRRHVPDRLGWLCGDAVRGGQQHAVGDDRAAAPQGGCLRARERRRRARPRSAPRRWLRRASWVLLLSEEVAGATPGPPANACPGRCLASNNTAQPAVSAHRRSLARGRVADRSRIWLGRPDSVRNAR